MTKWNFMLSWVEHEKKFYNLGDWARQRFFQNKIVIVTNGRLISTCAFAHFDQFLEMSFRMLGLENGLF